MRYDKSATFLLHSTETLYYNPETGRFTDDVPIVSERMVWFYDLTDAQKLEAFGRQDVRGIVLAHTGERIAADTVEVEGRRYLISASRQLRGKATYTAYSERTKKQPETEDETEDDNDADDTD